MAKTVYCPGAKNQHEMKNIQDVRISCLPPKESSTTDAQKNQSGSSSPSPGGFPIHISEYKAGLLTPNRESFSYVESQESPSWGVQQAWKKPCPTEAHSLQCRCWPAVTETNLCRLNSVCWASQGSSNQGAHRAREAVAATAVERML